MSLNCEQYVYMTNNEPYSWYQKYAPNQPLTGNGVYVWYGPRWNGQTLYLWTMKAQSAANTIFLKFDLQTNRLLESGTPLEQIEALFQCALRLQQQTRRATAPPAVWIYIQNADDLFRNTNPANLLSIAFDAAYRYNLLVNGTDDDSTYDGSILNGRQGGAVVSDTNAKADKESVSLLEACDRCKLKPRKARKGGCVAAATTATGSSSREKTCRCRRGGVSRFVDDFDIDGTNRARTFQRLQQLSVSTESGGGGGGDSSYGRTSFARSPIQFILQISDPLVLPRQILSEFQTGLIFFNIPTSEMARDVFMKYILASIEDETTMLTSRMGGVSQTRRSQRKRGGAAAAAAAAGDQTNEDILSQNVWFGLSSRALDWIRDATEWSNVELVVIFGPFHPAGARKEPEYVTANVLYPWTLQDWFAFADHVLQVTKARTASENDGQLRVRVNGTQAIHQCAYRSYPTDPNVLVAKTTTDCDVQYERASIKWVLQIQPQDIANAYQTYKSQLHLFPENRTAYINSLYVKYSSRSL